MSVPFSSSVEHTLAELERLDLLIQGQVQRARRLNTSDGQFQGLCITEDEVDRLLASPPGLPAFAAADEPDSFRDGAERLRAAIGERVRITLEAGIPLRLVHLAEQFELTAFDVDCLLVCLAPELDLRYERFFAYLQDDVTRKRPSVDLILNLLSGSFAEKLAHRERCLPESPLRANRLIEVFEDPNQPHPTLLARLVCLDERIAQYLLDSNEPDARLQPFLLPAEKPRQMESSHLEANRMSGLARLWANGNGTATVFHFNGPYGAGKRTTAEALCRSVNVPLLALDGERLIGSDPAAAEQRIRLAVREARLQNAALYWEGFSTLLGDDRKSLRKTLFVEAAGLPQPLFLAANSHWEPDEERAGVSFYGLDFPLPDSAARQRIWSHMLGEMPAEVRAADLGFLAGKFRFTAGQIQDSATAALHLAQLREPANTDDARITLPDLYEACRQQSAVKLSGLARKVKPHYVWNDIVLPADRIDMLREICNAVRYRSVIYDDWGFDRKLALGKGLSIMFSGPPGTGKTMAADVIAGELALDLYKIDLSGVVSKYIGETEKNLSRIFAEAESSNAILFFDEADALFGKRSEVKDSHDRYANIETGYLLQRMEEYEGMVILATNFRRNMDDAFLRRLHFVVEFPIPNEHDRARIWQQVWPQSMPRAADLDSAFLARRFELAGANIRNVAVAAAFCAADDGGFVTMPHVLHALRREFQKIGKVIMEEEFERRPAGMPLPANITLRKE